MTRILGGRYRNIRVINGKTCIKVQAVVPMPKDLKKAEKVCELNRWSMTSDHFGNLSVTTNMSFNAYLLSDRTLMDAYLGFAEKVASALMGNKSCYMMAGVASYDVAVA